MPVTAAAVGQEAGGEARADEAGGAGDDDLHALSARRGQLFQPGRGPRRDRGR